MIGYLKQYLNENLLGAYVHGSLGTYEEIPYSDFDALVIIKNEVFESSQRLAEVAKKLYLAQAIMFDFDPLQHHGWFVLTEAQLKSYPDYYFPVELFKYAKSLFPDKGLELEISIKDSPQKYKESFDNLSAGITERIDKRKYPPNIYHLKGLLSQFMLLPALYVQVRDKKGIFKKYSFGEAKKDFSERDWSIMDKVSSLRENWFYEMSPFKKWLITKPTQISRFIAKKYAPSIPKKMRERLTEEFYQRIRHLAAAMQNRLK